MSTDAILPLGLSPVQSFRVLKKLVESGFKTVLLAVSEQTLRSAQRLIEIAELESPVKIETVMYNEIEQTLQAHSQSDRWTLLLGPGHMEMSLHLWSSIITSTNNFPVLLIHHIIHTKAGRGKPKDSGRIHSVTQKKNIGKLPSVSSEEACSIYGVEYSEFASDELISWNNQASHFVLRYPSPDGAAEMTKDDIRAWEEKEVLRHSKEWTRRLGKHAVRKEHEPLPSTVVWENTRIRLDENGFRGGNK